MVVRRLLGCHWVGGYQLAGMRAMSWEVGLAFARWGRLGRLAWSQCCWNRHAAYK
ncbi:hypothetical protein [Candidatus Hodgkinia cicadicola]|uniref:hypothetical protein n=1 Tax=Candidatus Hodgkinia cicadicola TaxID=573658 RepID=UPI0024155F7E